MGHRLTLTDRERLVLTGVTEIAGFDENTVVLHTALGTLVVQGSQLRLKELLTGGGQVTVEGSISSLLYEETRQRGGWLSRLLK